MSLTAERLFAVNGLVTIVTGAASGLGLAISRTMAANGADLILVDRNEKELRRIGEEIIPGADIATVDVADPDAIRRTVDDVVTRKGRLDVMFANAGISGGAGIRLPQGHIENVDFAAWSEVLAINQTGAFATIQAAARHMKVQRSGRIVVTASVGGLRGSAATAYAYAAAKAAVVNLVRQAALELATFDVKVNAIAPGFFRTGLGGGRRLDEAATAPLQAMVPMNRLGMPDEIAGVSLLLASPAASYITGSVFTVDGGISAA
ncbi:MULTISPECIES: SDR family NAD(P)-dependent oxidoreductase [unclassified Bradyrhizobium]|uniref:SDR family NAD(P)-dependent oxidoreductase n=1 Tax=unclassified Bradyrhizobium TaxID=2631580 RepID=UPI0028E5B44E|nr:MULTISPECIES: SDR family NAD(P)-dependent oxidoreductase [unclassified Bradyrhizobium]